MDNTKLTKGIALPALIAMVVSSSIGAGIFDIPSTLSKVSTPGATLVAWAITGFGIFMLALSFSNLVLKRHELNGVSAYAKAGFGDFSGFLSGWGYWLSAWLGNVAFATMMMQAIGYFIPEYKTGNSIIAIITASVVSWGLTILVIRGVETAAFINTIVTIAKLVPLILFIIGAVIVFKAGIFTAEFWTNVKTHSNGSMSFSTATFAGIWEQVSSSLMSMIWVFIGVEGAAMMADRAKTKSDAARATIIGLTTLIIFYVIISMLPYGYLNQSELAKIDSPALMYLMKDMMGPIGGAIVSIGLMISILGSWLSWTMLPVEATSQMAQQGLLPKWFGKMNKNNAPANSLILTAGLVQLFLISLIWTESAYNFAYSLSTAVILVAYAFVSAFQLKVGIQDKSIKNIVIGLFALAFQVLAIIFAGIQYLWLASIAYILGFIFYVFAKKKENKKIPLLEWLLIVIVSLAALAAIICLSLGKLSL
ncbi:MAG: basic amino acid/polyamine antiporter [Lactobacillaceae bacterium]|jgi:arginine:ornithine antiporter/lysine permease|nr:basic amino acid/polyamine antiporter [Lactobacillaceae bacterium]